MCLLCACMCVHSVRICVWYASVCSSCIYPPPPPFEIDATEDQILVEYSFLEIRVFLFLYESTLIRTNS